MRSLVLATMLALAVAWIPLAAAEPQATLSIAGPADPVDVTNGTANATLQVTLTLQGFSCPSDAAFQVDLRATASGDAQAALASDQLVFHVPADSYDFAPYQGRQDVDIRLAGGAGVVNVTATFQSDGGECIAVGGFPDAQASAQIQTTTGESAGTTPPPSTPAANATATNDSTNATATTTTPPTTPAKANATNASTGAVDALPQGGGYVGDYHPSESRSTPGPGLLAAGAAVGLAAWAWRRR